MHAQKGDLTGYRFSSTIAPYAMNEQAVIDKKQLPDMGQMRESFKWFDIANQLIEKEEERYGYILPIDRVLQKAIARPIDSQDYDELIMALIAKGANISPALYDAITQDNVRAIRAFSAAGADLDLKNKLGKVADEYTTRPLMKAIQLEKVPIIKALIDGGAKLNPHHFEGLPLETALRLGKYDIAEVLLDAGADIDDVLVSLKLDDNQAVLRNTLKHASDNFINQMKQKISPNYYRKYQPEFSLPEEALRRRRAEAFQKIYDKAVQQEDWKLAQLMQDRGLVPREDLFQDLI